MVTVSGTVDIDGTVTENARVYLVDQNAHSIVQETLTDSSGNYSFSGVDSEDNVMVVPWYWDESGQRMLVDRPVANVTDADYTPIPDSVVDHFEESIYEDQLRSLSDLYSDETGAFTRDQNAPVFEGSYSLKGSGDPVEMYSTSGLPRYPVQDETVRYNHQFGSSNADVAYIFGLRASGGTPDGYYTAQTRPQDNELRLFRSDGDMQYTQIGSGASVSLSSGTEYIGEVEWLSDGSITFRLLDSSESELASTSTTDTTFDSSGGDGIGWRVRGGQGIFDHLRVV